MKKYVKDIAKGINNGSVSLDTIRQVGYSSIPRRRAGLYDYSLAIATIDFTSKVGTELTRINPRHADTIFMISATMVTNEKYQEIITNLRSRINIHEFFHHVSMFLTKHCGVQGFEVADPREHTMECKITDNEEYVAADIYLPVMDADIHLPLIKGEDVNESLRYLIDKITMVAKLLNHVANWKSLQFCAINKYMRALMRAIRKSYPEFKGTYSLKFDYDEVIYTDVVRYL